MMPMAKRPVAVDGASASALVGTAMRSRVLDLVTMTTLSRDMDMAAAVAVEPRRRRQDMAMAAHHLRGMALAPVRTGAVGGMDRQVLMAAHRTAVPRRMAVRLPHLMAHPMDRRMGHPTALLGVATPIPRRTIHLDRVDFHRP